MQDAATRSNGLHPRRIRKLRAFSAPRERRADVIVRDGSYHDYHRHSHRFPGNHQGLSPPYQHYHHVRGTI